jgi:hypothetical protein
MKIQNVVKKQCGEDNKSIEMDFGNAIIKIFNKKAGPLPAFIAV